jgi:hypothetical protein
LSQRPRGSDPFNSQTLIATLALGAVATDAAARPIHGKRMHKPMPVHNERTPRGKRIHGKVIHHPPSAARRSRGRTGPRRRNLLWAGPAIDDSYAGGRASAFLAWASA